MSAAFGPELAVRLASPLPGNSRRERFTYKCPVCMSFFEGDAARRHKAFMERSAPVINHPIK